MGEKLQVQHGDITKMQIDAIVNAANTTLLGGGGVDGAIHRVAGPQLLEECRMLGGCGPGEARITGGYQLPARFVIHTVGPIWTGGKNGEAEILANCYRNSLQLAKKNGIKTLALPAISCGAYGYPIPAAAAIAIRVTAETLRDELQIERVVFVVSNVEIFSAYQSLLEEAGTVS